MPFTFVVLLNFSLMPNPKSYTYIDGNNNTYKITESSLIYEPISPKESSSGTYSGGEYKETAISSDQFLKIEKIIKTIIKDTKCHEATRQMGCGTLTTAKKTIFISMSSSYKLSLENELKACLK